MELFVPVCKNFLWRAGKKICYGAGMSKPEFSTAGHKQVWAKVNAHVDEGIRDLIEALSAFPKLRTFESCQGDVENPIRDDGSEGVPAMVFFEYGQHHQAHDYQEIADFVLGYLGPALMKEMGDLVRIIINVADYGWVRADLTVRAGAMDRTVETVRQLRREFKDQPPKL